MWFNDNVGNFRIAVCVRWGIVHGDFASRVFWPKNVKRETVSNAIFTETHLFDSTGVCCQTPFSICFRRRSGGPVSPEPDSPPPNYGRRAYTVYKRENCSTTERNCKSHFNGITAVHKQTVIRFYRRVPGLESVETQRSLYVRLPPPPSPPPPFGWYFIRTMERQSTFFVTYSFE